MKKLLAILLAVLMLFTLAACGDDDDSKSGLFGGFGGNETPETNYTSNTPYTPEDSYTTENPYNTETPYVSENPYTPQRTSVEEYVDKNGSLIASMMESSIEGSGSGMTCSSSIEARGNGIIVNINIDQLDNVDYSVKSQMQEKCDMMKGQMGNVISSLRSELPELEYLEYRLCEKDGDFLANVVLR